jgi:hypothetical protein
MLNTHKLIYILPDLTYIAELLPTKKEHTFSVQAFRQINGEFMDDNDLIPDNIDKLVSKIEPEEYHLVLPDFLFTNTIVEVADTSENKVNQLLKEDILPKLGLTKETHDIATSILTQYNQKSKVQISALEKSVLNSFRLKAIEKGIKISAVSPLSWTVKAMISLEPSISVIQIGSYLYLAEHYIGVDQTISFNIDETENIAETIKTLKGSESSIQTVYLLTNQLVENKLKENLSQTLPLQQLSTFAEEEKDLPSYVRQIIETSMKTLSIPDFPVPKFPLGKENTEAAKSIESEPETAAEPAPIKKTEPEIEKPVVKSEPTVETSALPKPQQPALEAVSTTAPAALPAAEVVTTQAIELITTESFKLFNDEIDKKDEPKTIDEAPVTAEKVETEPKVIEPPAEPAIVEQPVVTESREPNIAQFSAQGAAPSAAITPTKKVIKNTTDTSHMIKMVFLSIAVLCLTVAIGVGLGLGYLTFFANKNQPEPESPVVLSSPVPSPVPSPSPSPVSNIDKTKPVLVVNATTIAGKAGKIKKALTDAGFTTVDTGNAKGEYKSGNILLMKEDNSTVVTEMGAASGLTLTFSNKVAIEDPKEKYQAVIVLAE